MKTMTYVDALNTVLASATIDTEVAARLTALRDTLVKRASAPRKQSVSKATVINNGLRGEILTAIKASETPMTITDICAAVPSCADKSTHSMAALLSALVKSGEIVRAKAGKLTTYAIATEESEGVEE